MTGHNHHPGCTCGWCIGGWRNHATLRRSSSPKLKLEPQRPKYESYTNPNATCPVCGAAVFFYQSPFGGRVFFNDLGPPWPKHECTDNPRLRVNTPSWGSTWSSPSARRTLGPPAWEAAGWLPIFVEEVSRDDGWWLVRGHGSGAQTGGLVRFLAAHPVEDMEEAVAFYRSNPDLCTVEISYLADDLQKGLVQREFTAFRLAPFHPLQPAMVAAAMAGDAEKALDLAYALSFAVRDREAEKPTMLPRFPDKIPWTLVKWLFELALGQGELLAAHNLAFMFFHGHGVPQDCAEGFRLLKLAEPLGLPRTFELIAECYEQGLGTAADAEQAAWYRAMARKAR